MNNEHSKIDHENPAKAKASAKSKKVNSPILREFVPARKLSQTPEERERADRFAAEADARQKEHIQAQITAAQAEAKVALEIKERSDRQKAAKQKRIDALAPLKSWKTACTLGGHLFNKGFRSVKAGPAKVVINLSSLVTPTMLVAEENKRKAWEAEQSKQLRIELDELGITGKREPLLPMRGDSFRAPR